jgi:hypothetical protein
MGPTPRVPSGHVRRAPLAAGGGSGGIRHPPVSGSRQGVGPVSALIQPVSSARRTGRLSGPFGSPPSASRSSRPPKCTTSSLVTRSGAEVSVRPAELSRRTPAVQPFRGVKSNAATQQSLRRFLRRPHGLRVLPAVIGSPSSTSSSTSSISNNDRHRHPGNSWSSANSSIS